MVTVVPFDWPHFLCNAAPSPFFAEFAAAGTKSGLPLGDAHVVPSSARTATLEKDTLLHQVNHAAGTWRNVQPCN